MRLEEGRTGYSVVMAQPVEKRRCVSCDFSEDKDVGRVCGIVRGVWGPTSTPEEVLAGIFGRLIELVFAILARPQKRDAMPGG